ncbi:MAG: enoyl-CoA hydratase/isomerase family protein [Microthrixaceae bacterium]
MSNEINQELSSAESTALVLVEVDQSGVAVITLQNGKVNALSVELLHELQQAVAQLAVDDNVRSVVITGNDRAFAAGADITQFAEHEAESSAEFGLSSISRLTQIAAAFFGALNAVAALPCPTIAAVSGVALGGGCELALACDFRVAGPKSRFGQPEILLGIIPGGGGTQRLSRLVGPSLAKDLIFSGRMVDADEALSIGLVNKLALADQVVAEAMSWAQSFAQGPRHATALAKAAIDGGLEGTLEDGLALEQVLFVQSFAAPDATVGVESFLKSGPGHAEFG